MRKQQAVLFTVLIIFLGSVVSYSQSCVSPINNTTINLSCGQSCGNLNLQIPDLRRTSDYIVSTIPYTPYTFITPGGSEDPNIYNDDRFSVLSPIGFPFCFYDSVFTQVLIGSNGIISFDYNIAGCPAGLLAPWNIVNPIPYNSNQGPCAVSTSNYPRSSIMGVFMDLDPRPGPGSPILSSPPERKIQWRTEGTAPCRKFIVSYYHVGVFQATSCGLNNPATFQIVLYESSGIVDIYIENKECNANSTNGTKAITGIMDWTRTKAKAAPGKNATPWTATNEAYRFTPSNGTTRYIGSQLYTLSGNQVAFATISNSTAGLIDISFPNICPASGSEKYIVKTTYASCSNPLASLVFDDTITVNKTPTLGATSTVTNLNCTTGSGGTITVTIPSNSGVSPYQYSLNSGPYQSSNVFTNLPVGNYTILATDVNGCSSTMTAEIIKTGNLGVGYSSSNVSCSGINNGIITILPPSLFTPLQYSINGGLPQTSNIFAGLTAGTYTINVTDAVGCAGTTTVTLTQGAGVTANFSTTPTSCSGANNGTITVTPGGTNFPYEYSLNGGSYQSGNIFSNLAQGNYSISVRDVNGCSNNFSVTVNAGTPLNATISKSNVTCYNGINGSITINISSGTPPYQYSLDNVTWQTGNSFSGLAAGTYTVYYRDINACSNLQQVIITQPADLNIALAAQPTRCFGGLDGKITVTGSGGTSPYQYSLDGIVYQSSNTFNRPAGIYTVYIKDNNGCLKSQSTTITQPTALTATTTITDASCNGGADGQIIVNASGGTAPFGYTASIPPLQNSNTLNVLPGIYNVTVVDANSCVLALQNIIVGLKNNLTIIPTPDETICEGNSVQLDVNTNANQFSWSPASGLSNGNIKNPLASPATTTEYIVTATYGLCSTKDTLIVNVNPAPIADAGPDGDICFGQNYTLQGSGGSQFSWTPSTSLSSTNISNPVSTPQQTITYNLSVTDDNSCTSLIQDQVIVKVTPPIIVKTFPSDTVVFAGDKFQLLATSAATDYTWSPPVGLSDPFVNNPFLNVTSDITFNVSAITSAGCRGEGSVVIKVFKGPEIYVPTGFTPNGDGRNDKLKPFTVGIVNLTYFRVYNRWGQLLFSTVRLDEGWDGKVKGVEQQTGTYIWMVQGITVDGKKITKKGTVTLIR